MKSVDRSLRGGIESKMKTRAGRLNRSWLLLQRENIAAPGRAISSRVRRSPNPRYPKTSERGVVKSDGALEIRDAERNMTKHASS
jgi:hypothetical protein